VACFFLVFSFLMVAWSNKLAVNPFEKSDGSEPTPLDTHTVDENVITPSRLRANAAG
jgi:hypothetical protein